ncbi:hypothetical protein G7Y79_00004g013450 [Physcia stellaris]|nr:hypothetical protein G7Y79_00004g013450 [Physcia stellaris]
MAKELNPRFLRHQDLMPIRKASDPSTLTPPSAVSLPRLPLEVQLCILRECLTSQNPLLNFHWSGGEIYHTVKDEPRGQDDIGFGILSTCKLYHQEGRKILYANNDFVYTSTLYPPETIGYPVFDARLPLFTALKHLTLRLANFTNHMASQMAVSCCEYWLAQASQLLTLQIDLVFNPEEPYENAIQEKFLVHYIQRENAYDILQVHKYKEQYSNWRSDSGGLSRVVITGLGDNPMGLLLVKTISHLLAEQGSLGLGIGTGGSRYVAKPGLMDSEINALPEPSLIWLTNKDREAWIKTKSEEMDPNGTSGLLKAAS